jgi:hypothetical protein
MTNLTLAEAGLLNQNPLVAGVIEAIVTTNQIYRALPFSFIEGNAMSYNRELSLGDSQIIGVGSAASANAITAKAPTKVTQATAKLVPIIGDAEIDHFEMVTMNTVNEQEAIQVAGKAKSIGRQFQDKMINGNSSTVPNEFDGLARLVPAAQQVGTAGASFDFGILDKLMDKVKSKDGQVDYFMMNGINVRRYLAKLRGLGGASVNEVVQLPGGTEVIAYRKVPIFQNDWIAVDATSEPALNRSDVYAGVFDDGSKKIGLAGIGASRQNGIFVTRVGEKEGSNEVILRVRMYAGLALFSELGIAMAPQVDD